MVVGLKPRNILLVEDEPTLFKSLRSIGLRDLIKTSVNSKTLTSAVIELRAAGKKDPKGIKLFEKPTINFRSEK